MTNLTKVQLQGIYGNCSVTDWSQVGGSAGPIVVYGVVPGAGVKSNFNSYLGITKGSHAIDPLTGVNYRTEIENTLSSFGLVPIAYGPTGGSASGSSFCRETDG